MRQGLFDIAHGDGVRRRQRGQAPAHVLQLAHIAGPVVCAQRLARGRGHALGRHAELGAGLGQEVLGQARHVAATLAQRRQLQAHHVQAMQQVGAETAGLHQAFQVLVGGGDHAHVHADQLAPADAKELALGQHAQQARLQRQRHVADLVQEQRAAIGLFEAADVSPLRTGERASLMAEQLALQQLGRNGRGVERHERLARARGLVVQGARDQLLAGAGLAGDQHRQRRLRQAADRAEQPAHGRRVADQLRRAVARLRHRFGDGGLAGLQAG